MYLYLWLCWDLLKCDLNVDEEEAAAAEEDFILLKAFCIQFSTYSCQHTRDVAQ